ncbi:hypothetical protein ND860_17925 [Leptospira levettii]|uniref:hypothetical protein n=1 Tax=Leptospira levettii TaxID=2023178 RepID=UPI00223D8843|nr:hypothetical protein [Leptospira levettii]MCW7498420.1 hypothetical protein [Leptospira levettii]
MKLLENSKLNIATKSLVSRDYIISKLTEDFDSIIENFENSEYEAIFMTFTGHGYGKVFIKKDELDSIVAKCFQSVENKLFRGYLRGIYKNLDRIITLNFPRLAFIHSKDKFDVETHLHVLALFPRQLIPTLKETFIFLLKEYCKNCKNSGLNISIGARFHSRPYTGSSVDFISYCTRKDKYDSDKDYLASFSDMVSRYTLGRVNSNKKYKDGSPNFIKYHENFLINLPRKPTLTLAQVRSDLGIKMTEIASNPSTKYTLLKSDVGTGKSYFANSLPVKFPNKKILVLVKRHENYSNYSNYKGLPPLPEELQNFFENNKESGINSHQLLEKLEPTTSYLERIRNLYLEYKETEKKILNESQFVVATHSKFFHGSIKKHHFELIIFDECLVDEMTRTKSVSFEEMDKFKTEKSFFSKMISKAFEKVNSDFPHRIDFNDVIKNKIAAIHDQEIQRAVELLSSGKKYKNSSMKILSLLKQPCLILKTNEGFLFAPDLKSYLEIPESNFIILSATASEPIYERIFRDDLNVCKLDSPELLAKITQNVKINFTKSSISKIEIKQQAQRLLAEFTENDYKTIGFKELNPDGHFFAVSSNNNLSGMNLYVQGTPNPERNKFLLLISLLGYKNVKIKKYDTLKYARDSYKDYDLNYFQISNSDEVNQIYYSQVESELIQAIGQTRPFEHKSEVVIHSAFPVNNFAKFR